MSSVRQDADRLKRWAGLRKREFAIEMLPVVHLASGLPVASRRGLLPPPIEPERTENNQYDSSVIGTWRSRKYLTNRFGKVPGRCCSVSCFRRVSCLAIRLAKTRGELHWQLLE